MGAVTARLRSSERGHCSGLRAKGFAVDPMGRSVLSAVGDFVEWLASRRADSRPSDRAIANSSGEPARCV